MEKETNSVEKKSNSLELSSSRLLDCVSRLLDLISTGLNFVLTRLNFVALQYADERKFSLSLSNTAGWRKSNVDLKSRKVNLRKSNVDLKKKGGEKNALAPFLHPKVTSFNVYSYPVSCLADI